MVGLSFSEVFLNGLGRAMEGIITSSIIWLPLALTYLVLWLWVYRARAEWLKNLEWALLEIKLPKEIARTPQAMEVALMAMHSPVDAGDLLKKWLKGELRIWSSFELVSIGGVIRFFIRVPKSIRNRVESALYSQYPGIEIMEAEDYTNAIPYGLPGSEWKMMGTEFALVKDDAYPIKTYVDYGTDRIVDVDDLTKVDPMTPMIEYLGMLKPGEQIWIQILAIATRNRFSKEKKWGEIWYQPKEWFKQDDWTEAAKKEVKKIREGGKKKEGEENKMAFLTPGQSEILKAIERTVGKPAFDCGIRAIYWGNGDSYTGSNFGGMISSFTQYNSASLNGFKPLNLTGIKYPWQDLTGRKLALKKARMFDAFRRRGYFYPPYVKKQMVLTTEELATIYHFPGKMAATPSLPKIESKRSEPPTNLPV